MDHVVKWVKKSSGKGGILSNLFTMVVTLRWRERYLMRFQGVTSMRLNSKRDDNLYTYKRGKTEEMAGESLVAKPCPLTHDYSE